MLLAVDIGNTHAKFGIFDENGALVADWRAVTDHDRTADEWGVLVERFLALRGYRLAELRHCIISSVVPPATAAVSEMVRRYLQAEPLIVSAEIDIGIPVRVPNPAEVGADRLVNAVAAVKRYGAPAIVIDLGTATTFDVVAPDGAYIGGVIAPGLQLSASALFSRAARLFKVDFVFPPNVIGNTSATAMQSGLMWGYASLIEGIVARITDELQAQPIVIATGGLAEAMAEHTACINVVDQALTVDGLYEIWKRNCAS